MKNAIKGIYERFYQYKVNINIRTCSQYKSYVTW